MRIQSLDGYHVRIPLRGKVKHAAHARSDTHSIVVGCRLDDGTEGWGEGLPRSYVTGETIETAWDQFRAADWPRMLGERFSDLRGAVALCERVSLDGGNLSGQRDCFGNSLRCAIEIAVLDAAARACGRPLSDVTSLIAETADLVQDRQRVRYSAVLTALAPVKSVLRGLAFRLLGFNECKMKVGMTGTDDRTAVLRARRALGGGCDLRVDANGAWTCRELQARVSPLASLGVSSLEQPVPHEEVNGLAAIRPHLGIPVMLDESLCSQSDAEQAIERETCDLFNIRLSKCGGFIPSLRIAAIAARAGLGYQLGCQVGETGILSAAGRHFATSVAGIRHLEGSFDRLLVAERLTAEDLTFGWGGWAPALRGPGLGVTIDRAGLERVTVARENRRVAA
jgi:muconate cycloisomerase